MKTESSDILFPKIKQKRRNIKTQPYKTDYQIRKNIKKIPLNTLYFNEKNNNIYANKCLETEFLKNKTQFYKPKRTSKDLLFYNSKEKKIPNIENKLNAFERFTLTDNCVKRLYKENKPFVISIFEQFEELNKKFIEQTKYYNKAIKNGDKFQRFRNEYSKGLKGTLCLTKPNNKRNYSNIYQRIKALKEQD